ncbi:uncharacterized protein LOC128966502 [Oppia nitens]|uniref:uncharacterized protein LOC128966502 n=1 Tax=Oppia nitens TaxID=1686743 RepID=UPI0023DA212B|nr:uncharacterized protein LOC128966502 [Oppia nitens]
MAIILAKNNTVRENYWQLIEGFENQTREKICDFNTITDEMITKLLDCNKQWDELIKEHRLSYSQQFNNTKKQCLEKSTDDLSQYKGIATNAAKNKILVTCSSSYKQCLQITIDSVYDQYFEQRTVMFKQRQTCVRNALMMAEENV